GNNVNSASAVDLITSDGVRIRGGPVAIGFFDPLNGKNVILATVRDTAGELTAANEITFKRCFEGLAASVRVTYKKSGISHDLLIHESPPAPETLGLSEYSRLELYTELTPDTPAPEKTTRVIQSEN